MTRKLQKKGLEISIAQGVGHHVRETTILISLVHWFADGNAFVQVPHENAEVAATAIYRMLSKFGVQNARL